jgi:hypothetical protein
MTGQQHLCVHAHFYQPPREDPFTGEIPEEKGASPYKNWNEKIFEDCYKPNAELGNFSKISFNLGPTLSQWMKANHPAVLDLIVEADSSNVQRLGVGNAMAQPFHHTILPYAKRRDKQTQVRWGIHEFMHTFNHAPKGMWLPETAVDLETLEVLALNGIEFTILAPWQAQTQGLDTHKAYQVILPNHLSLKVFFYAGGVSSRVSFDAHSTVNADEFIRNFIKPEFQHDSNDQLLIVATDGELYGHHQVFRDKFLAQLVNGSLSLQNVESTFPANWLKKQQAFPIIKIHEKTSWSCHHGIKRWGGVCECTPHSEWKKHFRDAMDRLSILLDQIYSEEMEGIFVDVWDARDRYIEVMLGEKDFQSWLGENTRTALTPQLITKIRFLLDAQVESQKMFTSCGWFFEDLDRIEPRNNLVSAAHAIWLTQLASGIDLVDKAIPELEKIKSWRTSLTGADVFRDALHRFEQTSQK